MKLRISDDLPLPAELAGRRTAVFGISGSGKSNTATLLIEQLLKCGEQVVLIDPKGEGWGLLSLQNGKPSNLPLIVFGEPNGHIETLSENHGARLADFVVESGRSAVFSLLGFESDQAERRFVATFLRQLYRRKSRQANPTRTLVVLEEAHLFIPESAGRGLGDAAELSGAVQRIVRQGRTFGLGTLLIDQRPQDVAKRVITQCDTLICHQLVHKIDRDALRDWVRGYDTDGQGDKFLESVASLEPGQAWIWSPAWLKVFKRIKVNRRTTYDTGAAPSDDQAARAIQRAEVDLDQLRGQLAEIVDKAKADDSKELRKEIASLKKQLAERPTEKAQPIEVPVITDEQIAAMREVIGLIDKAAKDAQEAWSVFSKVGADWQRAIDHMAHRGATEVPKILRPSVQQKPRVSPAPTINGQHHSSTNGDLPRGERATLSACIQFPAGLRREQLTVLTGYKRSSRDAYISRLREKGLADVRGDLVVATESGVAALPDFEPLPTGQALQDYWLQRLPEGERVVLRVLIEAYPNVVQRAEIDERTPYKRSSRDAYLARLAAKELVVQESGGVKASDNLFD